MRENTTKPPKIVLFSLTTAISIVLALFQFPPATATPIYNAANSCPVITTLKGTNQLSLERLLISEDCKTIYVKPPNFGKLVLDSIAGAGSLFRCDEWNSELQTLKNFSDAKVALSDQYLAAIKNQRPLTESDAIKQRADQLDNSVTTLRTNLRTFFEKIDGANATGLLTIPWEGQIEDFSALNKERLTGIQVSALPTVGGYLSFVGKQYSPVPSTGQYTFQHEFPGIFSVDVAGLESIFEVLATSDVTSRLSPLIGNPRGEADTVAFESGAAASIHLSLIGACQFYDTRSRQFKATVFSDPATSPLAFVTATYTYFFPMASEGSVTITLDVEKTAELIMSRIDTATGDVNAEAVVEDMMKVEGPGTSLSVKVSHSVVNPFTPEQVTALKQEALSTLTHGILSRLGTLIGTTNLEELKFATKPVMEESRLKHHCGRSGFLGLSRKCSTHTYKVQIEQSVREKGVRRAVADIQASFSNELITFDHFLNFGSVPFRVSYEPAG